MNDFEEDAWNIASWKVDIPGKVSYIKHSLSCTQFPECSRNVTRMLERYFTAYAPDTPPNPGLYLSAFLDDVIDLYIFHSKAAGAKSLSAMQELQLLEVVCSCFQDQVSDIVRCEVFYLLFGISNQDIKDGKVDKKVEILTKLVSMAVALQCDHLLESMAIWMQRHHHRPDIVLKVTSAIVEDYTCLVPASLPFLEMLASHSPLMACQLMIALINLYPVVTDIKQKAEIPVSGSSNVPPLSLLKVVASWISDNPDLCLTTCPAALLTAGRLRGSLAPPESTPLPSGPILGLLRWVVLMPLAGNYSAIDGHTQRELRLLYSQLHLAIIQAFLSAGKNEENPQDEMELEPGEVMDESDSSHLIKGAALRELTQDMINLIEKIKTAEFKLSFVDQQVQLSLDRYAQTLQVAIATGCVSASKDELVAMTKLLPANRLLRTVSENLGSS